MKERLKDLRQGVLSIREYKDRFDELVEYFPHLSDKDKQIFFVTGLQNSIKYVVKAWKPHTLGKAYSMALTFEIKNVELAKENKLSFDVSRKVPSRENKFGKAKSDFKSSHVQRGKSSFDRAINSPTKIKQITQIKDCTTLVMSQDIWLKNVCEQRENVQSSLQRWQWRWNRQLNLKVKK